MKFTLDRKILAGFIGAAVILIVVALYSFNNSEKVVASDAWVEHTQKVRFQLQQVLIATVYAETGVRGYALVGTDNYLEPFEQAKINIATYMDSLRYLTSDNPVQQAN